MNAYRPGNVYRFGARGDRLLIALRRHHDQPRLEQLRVEYRAKHERAVEQIAEIRRQVAER